MSDHKEIFSKKEELFKVSVEAGKLLLDFQKKIKNLTVETKKGQGLVTEADREAEKLIITSLKNIFPGFNYYAEESTFFDDKNVNPETLRGYLWLIDPLDGTNNFLSSFDYFSVSICLCFNGVPVWGSVYRPSTRELFYAELDQGAFYRSNISEDEIIMSKDIKNITLKDSMLTTGFTSEKGIVVESEFDQFKKILRNVRGVRRLGSAALDLSYTALGMWDGFWERDLCAWDVGAGALICLESGISVTDFEGEAFTPFQKSIIASKSSIHQSILETLH